MNSSNAERVGAQRPTHLLTPEGRFDFSDGDIAVELAAALGLVLFDWQRWLVRWILAVDEHGRPACNTVIIVVPRQNGKGAVLECIELFWLLVGGVPLVIHTAHEADTAAGHQNRLDALTADPDIALPKLKNYTANGKEKLANLDEKLLLQFRTRTKATKRGASPRKIILDESQEINADHMAALVPSLAAQSKDPDKRPQLIYAGSAPLEHSIYMHQLIEQVQKSKPAKTLLAMWACTADDDPADTDCWYRANPSLGLLIDEEWVRTTEYMVLPPHVFSAERLGVPRGGKRSTVGPISKERWVSLIDGDSLATEETISLGLDAPIGRATAVFAAAGSRADNLRHMSIRYWVEADAIGRVVEVARQLTDGHGVAVNIPAKSPALAWLDQLEAAEVPVNVVGDRDMQNAQAAIEQDISDGTIRHRGQLELVHAVDGLAARASGDVSPWSRRSSSSDISPLMAAAAARAGGRGEQEEPAEFFIY